MLISLLLVPIDREGRRLATSEDTTIIAPVVFVFSPIFVINLGFNLSLTVLSYHTTNYLSIGGIVL
jgi:hypothetical protein